MLAASVLLALAGPASAVDQSSASYTARAGHFSAAGSDLSVSTTPSGRFLGSGTAIGHTTAGGFSGSESDLGSNLPGFWAAVVGAFPLLDLDGDLLQAWRDADDDGDGLDDVVETNTAIFLGPGDTGTDPYLADSDGDGFFDLAEVLGGSDPNEDMSFPLLAVPALGLVGLIGLIVMLSVFGSRTLRSRDRPIAS